MISAEINRRSNSLEAFYPVLDLVKRENIAIPRLTAVCSQCGNTLSGKIFITKDGYFPPSPIIDKCLTHHEQTRAGDNLASEHNTFTLMDQNNKVGRLAVSSAGTAGLIDSSFLTRFVK